MGGLSHPVKITVLEIPENDRLDCLAQYFGRHRDQMENLIYDFMRGLSPEYTNAYWRVFHLSNGGFYMAPDLNVEKLRIHVEDGYDGALTPDAGGISACLLALRHFGFAVQDEGITQSFRRLSEYVSQHPESANIHRASE